MSAEPRSSCEHIAALSAASAANFRASNDNKNHTLYIMSRLSFRFPVSGFENGTHAQPPRATRNLTSARSVESKLETQTANASPTHGSHTASTIRQKVYIVVCNPVPVNDLQNMTPSPDFSSRKCLM
jgi:hypothetical protein